MVRANIAIDEKLYRRAKTAARRRGISVAEFWRSSLAEAVARDSQFADQPWMAFAGIVDGDLSDSESVDAVVYGREHP